MEDMRSRQLGWDRALWSMPSANLFIGDEDGAIELIDRLLEQRDLQLVYPARTESLDLRCHLVSQVA